MRAWVCRTGGGLNVGVVIALENQSVGTCDLRKAVMKDETRVHRNAGVRDRVNEELLQVKITTPQSRGGMEVRKRWNAGTWG